MKLNIKDTPPEPAFCTHARTMPTPTHALATHITQTRTHDYDYKPALSRWKFQYFPLDNGFALGMTGIARPTAIVFNQRTFHSTFIFCPTTDRSFGVLYVVMYRSL